MGLLPSCCVSHDVIPTPDTLPRNLLLFLAAPFVEPSHGARPLFLDAVFPTLMRGLKPLTLHKGSDVLRWRYSRLAPAFRGGGRFPLPGFPSLPRVVISVAWWESVSYFLTDPDCRVVLSLFQSLLECNVPSFFFRRVFWNGRLCPAPREVLLI